MRIVKCKGCGAPIVWIPTLGGKSMPCDAKQVIYKERKGAKGKIVTPNGEVLSAEPTNDLGAATGIGYVPHWATCPKAKDFKKTEE